MKESPIIFTTDMVQAIIEGRKTQTRRIVKGTALNWLNDFTPDFVSMKDNNLSPYGYEGDVLWVRERFAIGGKEGATRFYVYMTDVEAEHMPKWKPSIHMPRSAARIFLDVEEIRIERLHDITQEDAMEEGVKHVIDKITGYCGYDYLSGGYNLMTSPYNGFRSLWKSIHGEESWKENPWVWVIKFSKQDPKFKGSYHQLTELQKESLNKLVSNTGTAISVPTGIGEAEMKQKVNQ